MAENASSLTAQKLHARYTADSSIFPKLQAQYIAASTTSFAMQNLQAQNTASNGGSRMFYGAISSVITSDIAISFALQNLQTRHTAATASSSIFQGRQARYMLEVESCFAT